MEGPTVEAERAAKQAPAGPMGVGKPAASLGDLAAHGGTVVVGSPNVLIGGRPAARQGDSIACALHGIGTITQGSATVFINGMPASRLGDLTGCMAPGLAAISVPAFIGPPVKPGAKPIEHHSKGMTNAEADAAGKPAFGNAESKWSDENQDGNYDNFDGSFSLVHYRDKGFQNVGQHKKGEKMVGGAELSGTNEVDAGLITVHAHSRKTDTGFATGASLEGTSVRWGGMAALSPRGNKGLNQALGVGGEVKGPAFKVAGDALLGNDVHRHGFKLMGEAGVQVVGFETNHLTTIPLPKKLNIQIKEKAGATLGPAGLGGGIWLYYDDEKGRLYLGRTAKIRLLFGLSGEWEISVGKEFVEDSPVPETPAVASLLPFTEYTNTPGFGAGGIVGAILAGTPTVLIG